MALVQTGMYFFERGSIRDELNKLVQRQAPGARLSPAQMNDLEASAQRLLLLFHGGTIAVGLAFVVMGFFVEKYPVPITALALITFIGLNVIFAVVDVHNIYRGWILKLIFIIALSKALSAGIAAQKESQLRAGIDVVTPSADEPISESAAAAVPSDPAPVACWRCGRVSAPSDGVCPYCRARLTPADRLSIGRPSPADSSPPLVKVIIAFSIMMAASVIWGWIIHFDQPDVDTLIAGAIVIEAFDAILTLALIAWIGRLSTSPLAKLPGWAAWLSAGPVLAVVLLVNLGYHRLIEHFVHFPSWYRFAPLFEGVTFLNVLCVAVQPAIVEELFFRYAALGAMRQFCGVHAAVWISSVMFGFAHIYAPLGLPWLIVAGAVFGYARLSGGLPLSMVMHFLHNLVVLWLVGGV